MITFEWQQITLKYNKMEEEKKDDENDEDAEDMDDDYAI